MKFFNGIIKLILGLLFMILTICVIICAFLSCPIFYLLIVLDPASPIALIVLLFPFFMLWIGWFIRETIAIGNDIWKGV